MSIQLSIIVPVYNVEKYLAECLDSLLAQQVVDMEIICVNDGSSDKSLNILHQYANKDKRIKVINQKNTGVSGARNAGMRAAKGQYIAFVDSDDYVDANVYRVALEALYTSDADMVCFGVKTFGEKWFGSVDYFEIKTTQCVHKRTLDLYSVSKIVCNKVFKMNVMKKCNILFPEGIKHEDEAFFWKYISVAENIFFIKDIYYNYRIRKDSFMGSVISQRSNHIMDAMYVVVDIYHFWKHNGMLDSWKDDLNKIFWSMVALVYDRANKQNKLRVMQEISVLAKQMQLSHIYPDSLAIKNLYDGKYERLEVIDYYTWTNKIFSIRRFRGRVIICILGLKIKLSK